MDNQNYLPDLKNEKTGEQIVFKQKVFRANEAFRHKMNDLILWDKSPLECRQYPEKSQTDVATGNMHIYLSMMHGRKYYTKGLKIQMASVS